MTDEPQVESTTGADLAAPFDQSPEVVGVRRGSFGVSGSGDTSGFGGLVEPIVWPAPASRPFGEPWDHVTDEIELSLADRGLPATDAVERIVIDRGEITYYVRREHLVAFATMLRDEPSLRFEWLSGVSGVHYPDQKGRELHAVYEFRSITHARRIRVEVTCPDGDPHIPSIVAVYPTNDWHERETYDFFGIEFDGHPALTRIEMPDDWVGHPQRKDYSLNGIPVEYKGATVPPPNERRSYN
ncbi:MAG: NADH-quinone oxidoreductase subunit C [Candidatus Nanopelagicales bacterium]